MSTSHTPMLPLRQWLEHRFLGPVVLLAASAEAEASAAKNGLNMLQLLRPLFTSNRTLRARLTDRSDTTVIDKMHVRLHYPETVREVESATRQSHFMSYFQEVSPEELRKGDLLDGVVDVLMREPHIPNDEDDAATSTSSSRLPTAHQLLKPPLAGMSEESIEANFFKLHDTFARDYITMVRCSYFDCLDHPVGNILVGSTSFDIKQHPTILSQFRDLTRRCDGIREGNPTMDEELLAYYILVHDMSDGPPIADAQKLFSMIKNAVGDLNCCMLVINSGGSAAAGAASSGPPPPPPMRWVAGNNACDVYATDGSSSKFPRVSFLFTPEKKVESGVENASLPVSSNGQLSTGCYLTSRDVDGITTMAESFIANNLVPHLEKKHRMLSASIAERRKTGLSRVAAWFSSDRSDKKEKEAYVITREGAGKYLAGSVEMSMRRLADISMMLRDFDTANQWYKSLLDDLLSHLSSRPFNGSLIAAAHEGIAIATYFQGRLPLPSPSRANDCRFEQARDEYQRYLISSYSFRCSLLMYLLCRNKPISPANDRALAVLTNRHVIASIGTNRVYGAIVSDISAHCWLFQTFQDPTNKRGIRKFARLMCLAGSDYRRSQLSEHALRCFSRAQKVYRLKVSAKKWTSIYDNLIAELGALYFNRSDLTSSVGLYSAAVSTGSPIFSTSSNAAKNLDNYVSQLLAFMNNQNFAVLPHLLLPNVLFPKFTDRELRYGPDEETMREEQSLGGGVADREWSAMEDVLRAYYTKSTTFVVPKAKSTTQLIAEKRQKGGAKKKQSADSSAAHEAGVGETIHIPIAFHNPVASDLLLTNVALLFIENDENGKIAQGGGPNTRQMYEASQIAEVIVPSERRVDTAGLNKDPTTKIMLPFRADKVGRFCVVGVAWTVKGVRGQYLLSTKAKEEGKAETYFNYACENPFPVADCDRYIDITVHNPEATLAMCIEPPIPEYVRDGAVHRCELVITNKSSTAPASELAIFFSQATSHWIFLDDFSVADNEKKDAPLVLPKDITVPPNGTLRLGMTARMILGGDQLSQKGAAPHSAVQTVMMAGRSAAAALLFSGNSATALHSTQTVAHIAVMLSYYPHASNDAEMLATTRNVKLNTLLRRVNIAPAITVNCAVIPATERECDINAALTSEASAASLSVQNRETTESFVGIGSSPGGASPLPMLTRCATAAPVSNTEGEGSPRADATLAEAEATQRAFLSRGRKTDSSASLFSGTKRTTMPSQGSLLPFASLALVIMNRASRVDGPVKICRVTCLHDPSWEVSPTNAFGPLAKQAMEVSPDPLHFLTCSDQGIVLNTSIRRRAANISEHPSAFDGCSSQSQYLRRYLFLAQNRRLCETTILSEEDLMRGNEKGQAEMRRVTSAQCSPLGASLRSRTLAGATSNAATPCSSAAIPIVHADPASTSMTGYTPATTPTSAPGNQESGLGVRHQRVTSTMTNRSHSLAPYQYRGVEMHPIPLPLWYGLTHTYVNAGRSFGDVPAAGAADFAFYLDKGGAEKSAAEQEMEEDLMLAAEAVADYVPVLSGLVGEEGSGSGSFADVADVLSSGPTSPTLAPAVGSFMGRAAGGGLGGAGEGKHGALAGVVGSRLTERQRRKFARVAALNKAVYGQVPSQFPPVCFVVTWSSDVNSSSIYGQSFHFVDVQGQLATFANLPRDAELQQQRLLDKLSPTLGIVAPLFSSSRSGTMSVAPRPAVGAAARAGMESAVATSSGATSSLLPPTFEELPQATRAQLVNAFQRAVTPCPTSGMVPSAVLSAAVETINRLSSPSTCPSLSATANGTVAPLSAITSPLENDCSFSPRQNQLRTELDGRLAKGGATIDPVTGALLLPDTKYVCDGFFSKSRQQLATLFNGQTITLAQAARMLLPIASAAIVSMRPVYKPALFLSPRKFVSPSDPSSPTSLSKVCGVTSVCAATCAVDVVLTNHSSLPVKLTVAMLPTAWSRQQQERLPSAHIAFEGVTRYRFIVMPDESFTCSFAGTVTAAGLYNVNNTRFESSQVLRFVDGMSTGVLPDTLVEEALERSVVSLMDVKFAGADVVWPLLVRHPKNPSSSRKSEGIGKATKKDSKERRDGGASTDHSYSPSPFTVTTSPMAALETLPTEITAMAASALPSRLFTQDGGVDEDLTIDGLTPIKPSEHYRRAFCVETDMRARPPVLAKNRNPTITTVSPPPQQQQTKSSVSKTTNAAVAVAPKSVTGEVVRGRVVSAAPLVTGKTANSAVSSSAPKVVTGQPLSQDAIPSGTIVGGVVVGTACPEEGQGVGNNTVSPPHSNDDSNDPVARSQDVPLPDFDLAPSIKREFEVNTSRDENEERTIVADELTKKSVKSARKEVDDYRDESEFESDDGVNRQEPKPNLGESTPAAENIGDTGVAAAPRAFNQADAYDDFGVEAQLEQTDVTHAPPLCGVDDTATAPTATSNGITTGASAVADLLDSFFSNKTITNENSNERALDSSTTNRLTRKREKKNMYGGSSSEDEEATLPESPLGSFPIARSVANKQLGGSFSNGNGASIQGRNAGATKPSAGSTRPSSGATKFEVSDSDNEDAKRQRLPSSSSNLVPVPHSGDLKPSTPPPTLPTTDGVSKREESSSVEVADLRPTIFSDEAQDDSQRAFATRQRGVSVADMVNRRSYRKDDSGTHASGGADGSSSSSSSSSTTSTSTSRSSSANHGPVHTVTSHNPHEDELLVTATATATATAASSSASAIVPPPALIDAIPTRVYVVGGEQSPAGHSDSAPTPETNVLSDDDAVNSHKEEEEEHK